MSSTCSGAHDNLLCHVPRSHDTVVEEKTYGQWKGRADQPFEYATQTLSKSAIGLYSGSMYLLASSFCGSHNSLRMASSME